MSGQGFSKILSRIKTPLEIAEMTTDGSKTIRLTNESSMFNIPQELTKNSVNNKSHIALQTIN
jgi:hypothetical protein